MSEKTSELLVKAEDALSMGDWRTAGILLHKILLQDFTNRQAWLLLQQLRSDRQPLEDFQQSFAQKYYPNQAHLLTQAPESGQTPQKAGSLPEVVPSVLPPAIQSEVPTPVQSEIPASIQSGVPAPVQSEVSPAVPLRALFCPSCGAAILPKAIFCSFCGKPLSREREQVQTIATAGTLPDESEQSPLIADELLNASVSTDPEALNTASEWQPIEFETLGAASDVLSESEKKMITSELQELKALINKPQTQPSEEKPLTGELDRVLKRSTSPPRGTGSLDPNRIPPKRRPYCPTCRKLFEPDDLFCDICWAPLFQMVDKIPEEPAVASQPAAKENLFFDSSVKTPSGVEPEIPVVTHPEPEPEISTITPPEPEFDSIEDIRAAIMPESTAVSPFESSPRSHKADSHRSNPRLFRWIESLPSFVKGMLLGLALVVIGICLGVIAYISYQIWLG